MFSLAERLHAGDKDAELYERLMEEARWGLDWILKTSFGDGFRYMNWRAGVKIEIDERLRQEPSMRILGEFDRLPEDVHFIVILPMPAGPGCCAAGYFTFFSSFPAWAQNPNLKPNRALMGFMNRYF